MAHGVGGGDEQRPVAEGVVEHVPAHLVGGDELTGDRERCVVERPDGQQSPLHLRRERHGFMASCPFEGIAERQDGLQHVRHAGPHMPQIGEQIARRRLGGEVDLEDPELFGTQGQRDEHPRPCRGGHLDDLLGAEGVAGVGTLDRGAVALPPTLAGKGGERLQVVVDQEHVAAPGPEGFVQHVVHHVDDRRRRCAVEGRKKPSDEICRVHWALQGREAISARAREILGSPGKGKQ